MSIKPPSDLLLDVARAADPSTSAAAVARLSKIAAGGGKSDIGFSEVLNGVEAPLPSSVTQRTGMAMPYLHSAPINANKKAYQGLESLLLQNLVETMLPESSDLFGEGGAGMIWRSMLAQELGTDLAKKIDLGIQPKYLRASHGPATNNVKTSDAAGVPVSEIRHVVPKHT